MKFLKSITKLFWVILLGVGTVHGMHEGVVDVGRPGEATGRHEGVNPEEQGRDVVDPDGRPEERGKGEDLSPEEIAKRAGTGDDSAYGDSDSGERGVSGDDADGNNPLIDPSGSDGDTRREGNARDTHTERKSSGSGAVEERDQGFEENDMDQQDVQKLVQSYETGKIKKSAYIKQLDALLSSLSLSAKARRMVADIRFELTPPKTKTEKVNLKSLQARITDAEAVLKRTASNLEKEVKDSLDVVNELMEQYKKETDIEAKRHQGATIENFLKGAEGGVKNLDQAEQNVKDVIRSVQDIASVVGNPKYMMMAKGVEDVKATRAFINAEVTAELNEVGREYVKTALGVENVSAADVWLKSIQGKAVREMTRKEFDILVKAKEEQARRKPDADRKQKFRDLSQNAADPFTYDRFQKHYYQGVNYKKPTAKQIADIQNMTQDAVMRVAEGSRVSDIRRSVNSARRTWQGLKDK